MPKTLELEACVNAIAAELNIDSGELAVRIVDEEFMRHTNASFRKKDAITDVLSFPPAWPQSPDQPHLGDLLICWPRTLEQAEELGQSPEVEFRFLVLHGILHLVGYDHESDRGEMLALQNKIQTQLQRFFIDS
jgi:probable rRNA maturation factor